MWRNGDSLPFDFVGQEEVGEESKRAYFSSNHNCIAFEHNVTCKCMHTANNFITVTVTVLLDMIVIS